MTVVSRTDAQTSQGEERMILGASERQLAMSLDLADYETKALEAAKAFWNGRDRARRRQANRGSTGCPLCAIM